MKKPRQHITFKSIFGIVLILTVFSGIVSKIGYNGFTNALMSKYSDGAFKIADTAALSVEADKMDEAAKRGGADALAAINTIKSITGVNPRTYVSSPAVHGMSAV